MFLGIVKYMIVKPFVKPTVKGVHKVITLLETKKEEKKEENSLKDMLVGIFLLLICVLGYFLADKEYGHKIIEYFKDLFF